MKRSNKKQRMFSFPDRNDQFNGHIERKIQHFFLFQSNCCLVNFPQTNQSEVYNYTECLVVQESDAPPTKKQRTGNPQVYLDVKIGSSTGRIVIDLRADIVPKTAGTSTLGQLIALQIYHSKSDAYQREVHKSQICKKKKKMGTSLIINSRFKSTNISCVIVVLLS